MKRIVILGFILILSSCTQWKKLTGDDSNESSFQYAEVLIRIDCCLPFPDEMPRSHMAACSDILNQSDLNSMQGMISIDVKLAGCGVNDQYLGHEYYK